MLTTPSPGTQWIYVAIKQLQHSAHKPHVSAGPPERARISAASTNQEASVKEAMQFLLLMLSQETFS